MLIESMFSMEEATAAFDGVRSLTDLPIVVSFCYDSGLRTMMGVKPVDVIKKNKDMAARAVGANCGKTLENMEKIVIEYHNEVPDYTIWAKPNAGVPSIGKNSFGA